MKQTVSSSGGGGRGEESDLQHDPSDDIMELVFRALA